MAKIPNDLSQSFHTQAGRKKFIELYAESKTMFTGTNEEGERVYLSVSRNGIVLKT